MLYQMTEGMEDPFLPSFDNVFFLGTTMIINATHGADVRKTSIGRSEFVKPLGLLIPNVLYNERVRTLLPLCFVSDYIF